MRRPGSSRCRKTPTRPIDSIRLCTKKACPPRANSRSSASRTSRASKRATTVFAARRSSGGVSRVLMPRTPASASDSVRGIGVAVSVSTSTPWRSRRIRSLCSTPKRCSSSTMTSPRSANDDVGAEQPVRADDDVGRGRGQAREHGPLLVGRREARQRVDAHRERGEARREDVGVLLGEHRGRGDHRDLLAVRDRLERGPHRDLGLAVADVTAEQPVHRPRPLHRGADLLAARALVGRRLEGERVRELPVPLVVRGEGEARARPRARPPGAAAPPPSRAPSPSRGPSPRARRSRRSCRAAGGPPPAAW